MVPMGHHLMAHGQPFNHASQHSDPACAWMCAASTFAQEAVQNFDNSSNLTFENLVVYIPYLFSSSPIFALPIRPPPISA